MKPVHQRFVRVGAVALLSLSATALCAAAEASPTPDDVATTPEDYLRRGQEIALQAKQALGGNLKQAMEAGGPTAAVAFCNVRATPIAEEVSASTGATVSRVSDRPRNPDNAANEAELATIAQFKEALASGNKPTPALREEGDRVVAYYPIVTNGMCLKCHGKVGADIAPATQDIIQANYPQDRATGYGENELRGMFVVEMSR